MSGAASGLVLQALVRLRLLGVYQRVSGQTCAVLLYHSVSGGGGVPYYDVRSFAAQMDLLRDEFRVLSFEEWFWHRERGKPAPPRSVLITFDDSFSNNLHTVAPIMEQRQLPWMLLTTTQTLQTPARPLWFMALRAVCLFSPDDSLELLGREWSLGSRREREDIVRPIEDHLRTCDPRQSAAAVDDAFARVVDSVPASYLESYGRLLGAEELRELDGSPLVELSAHTRPHPFLTALPADPLPDEIDASLADLRKLLGHPVRSFAHPLGDYGAREVKYLQEIGLSGAVAVQPCVDDGSPLEVPRTGIYAPRLPVVRSKALGLSNVLRSVGLQSG